LRGRRRESDAKIILSYFDKAVEMNGYNETVLVARSREVSKAFIMF
jgi:hypothetical protein